MANEAASLDLSPKGSESRALSIAPLPASNTSTGPLPIISEGFPGKITSQTSEQEDPSSHHRRHSAKLTKLPCSQDLSQTELSDWNFGSAASKTTAQDAGTPGRDSMPAQPTEEPVPFPFDLGIGYLALVPTTRVTPVPASLPAAKAVVHPSTDNPRRPQSPLLAAPASTHPTAPSLTHKLPQAAAQTAPWCMGPPALRCSCGCTTSITCHHLSACTSSTTPSSTSANTTPPRSYLIGITTPRSRHAAPALTALTV
eukprot:CAMPEP_0202365108 /NCGR_PEP_ID=MMETSP1126-20121109/16238_1 /ASSEMBLY_ACC=CAM_ASM_000457 /TAXON_ID=3047 /ORGANISM="Dunaliella tertiolecta, Strain CCMP1320" /LENGTH=255 /DNA_ID=CAMNT_0048959865 /DNA_START=32 /DNA_END=800 /DNA_ORIENTATION=-